MNTKSMTTYLSIAMFLVVITANGQGTYIPTDSTDKSVLSYPFADSTFQSYTISQGDSVTLLATSSMTGTEPLGQLRYEWTPNTGIVAMDANATRLAPLETTVYTVTATTQDGITKSMKVEIVVLVPPVYSIPQSFSPNGDGIDDRFNLSHAPNVKVLIFKVFDRWGQLLFDKEDSNGWDGNHKGKPIPAGVYVYSIKIVLPDGTEEVLSDQLYLMR